MQIRNFDEVYLVESGEGIERFGLPAPLSRAVAHVESGEGIESMICRQLGVAGFGVESGEGIESMPDGLITFSLELIKWNPVKELKEGRCSRDRPSAAWAMWNPVKELKVGSSVCCGIQTCVLCGIR